MDGYQQVFSFAKPVAKPDLEMKPSAPVLLVGMFNSCLLFGVLLKHGGCLFVVAKKFKTCSCSV